MKTPLLVVEDNAEFRRAIAVALAAEEVEIVGAGSRHEAVQLLPSLRGPLVVLLDLNLPDGNGSALLGDLASSGIEHRTIVQSAFDGMLLNDETVADRVFSFLPKGTQFSRVALTLAVRHAIADLAASRARRVSDAHLEVTQLINQGAAILTTLKAIARHIVSLADGYTCHIRSLDAKAGDYIVEVMEGGPIGLMGAFPARRREDEAFSGIVVKSRVPFLDNDLRHNQRLTTFRAELGPLSSTLVEYFDNLGACYVVPVVTGFNDETVDAVVNVTSRGSGSFSEYSCAIVDGFAAQIGVALSKEWLRAKRAEIHGDYRRANALLVAMSRQLDAAATDETLVHIIEEGLTDLIGPEMVSVFAYDTQPPGLCSLGDYVLGSHRLSTESYQPGESLTGAVFTTGKPIRLPAPDVGIASGPAADPRINAAQLELQEKALPSGRLEHYLAVPMTVGAEKTGVVRVINKKSSYYTSATAATASTALLPRGFSEDCETLLGIAATHLGIVLKNRELLRRLRRKMSQLEGIAKVGREISLALEVESLLRVIAARTAEVLGAAVGLVFLRDLDSHSLVLTASIGCGEEVPALRYRYGEGLVGRVAESQEIVSGDENADAICGGLAVPPPIRQSQEAASRGTVSCLTAPVISKGSTIGVVQLLGPVDGRRFSDDDMSVLGALTSHIGVAVENARAFDLRNRQLAAAERNAVLSQLVRCVTHEIRNTAGLIPENIKQARGILASLTQNGWSDESQATAAERIAAVEAKLRRIGDVADQAVRFNETILGFSSARPGDRERVALEALVDRALIMCEDSTKGQTRSQGGAIERRRSGAEVYVEADARHLAQILYNIIDNALDALDGVEDGRLTITTGRLENPARAMFEFYDTGCGIAPGDLGRLFEPDFTRKNAGNGIGLWMTKTFLDGVGGTIDYASELGRWTRVTVTIPL